MRHAKNMLPVKVEIRRTIGKEVGETVGGPGTADTHLDKNGAFSS